MISEHDAQTGFRSAIHLQRTLTWTIFYVYICPHEKPLLAGADWYYGGRGVTLRSSLCSRAEPLGRVSTRLIPAMTFHDFWFRDNMYHHWFVCYVAPTWYSPVQA